MVNNEFLLEKHPPIQYLWNFAHNIILPTKQLKLVSQHREKCDSPYQLLDCSNTQSKPAKVKMRISKSHAWLVQMETYICYRKLKTLKISRYFKNCFRTKCYRKLKALKISKYFKNCFRTKYTDTSQRQTIKMETD